MNPITSVLFIMMTAAIPLGAVGMPKPSATTIGCNDMVEEDMEYGIASLNPKIQNYLKAFEKIKLNTEDEAIKNAMGIIEELITQSWVHTLQPGQALLPRNENMCAKDLEQTLVKKIHDINKITPVSDAILLYSNRKENCIQQKFEIERERITNVREVINDDLKNSVRDAERKKILQAELIENTKNLQEVKDNLDIHNMAKKMYLQSYVLDFVRKPYSETITITSSEGDTVQVFPVPPLDFQLFMDN